MLIRNGKLYFSVGSAKIGNILIPTVFTDFKEPTGFVSQTDVSLSFANGTRTLTVTPVASPTYFYIKGVPYTIDSADTLIISDTHGMHWIYYGTDNALHELTTFDSLLFTDVALVAAVYWDATNSEQIYLGREAHGFLVGTYHEAHHFTEHTTLQSGGGIANLAPGQDGSLAAHAEFGTEVTIIWDEALKHTLSAKAITDNIAVYYLLGSTANNYWFMDELAPYAVLPTGTGRAAYNLSSGGNWSLAECSNNSFVLAHVFAYNDTDREYGVIMGQANYTNIAQARDGALEEIKTLSTIGLPVEEILLLGTLVLQTSNSYANAVKSRVRLVNTEGDDYIDLRSTVIALGNASGTVTDHGSLGGLLDDDHSQYIPVDGTRSFTGTATFDAEYDNGTKAAAFTIDWNNGQKQKVTLNSTGMQITFTDPIGVGNFILKLVQDDTTGSRTVLWPSGTLFVGSATPTLSTDTDAIDIAAIYFDGTDYYISVSAVGVPA